MCPRSGWDVSKAEVAWLVGEPAGVVATYEWTCCTSLLKGRTLVIHSWRHHSVHGVLRTLGKVVHMQAKLPRCDFCFGAMHSKTNELQQSDTTSRSRCKETPPLSCGHRNFVAFASGGFPCFCCSPGCFEESCWRMSTKQLWSQRKILPQSHKYRGLILWVQISGKLQSGSSSHCKYEEKLLENEEARKCQVCWFRFAWAGAVSEPRQWTLKEWKLRFCGNSTAVRCQMRSPSWFSGHDADLSKVHKPFDRGPSDVFFPENSCKYQNLFFNNFALRMEWYDFLGTINWDPAVTQVGWFSSACQRWNASSLFVSQY